MNTILNVVPDNFKQLPIYLYTLNNRHNQESINHLNISFHQILIILDGKGTLTHKNKSYPLRRGCAFFIGEGTSVKYINNGGLVSAYVTAKGNAVAMMMNHFECDGFLFYENIDLDESMAEIDAMIAEYRGKQRSGVMSAMLYSFYAKFFEKDRESKISKIDKTVLYIEKNHMKKLTLKKIAEVNESSVSKLCSDFKNKFGCTVFEYLIDFRLKTANMLLRTTAGIMTKEVAHKVGFEDVSYFCRVYKKKFGTTPLG